MTLQVRASRVVVATGEGRFVDELAFQPGLNILRADNNMGKTTTLMSIIYALGWEGMLGAGHAVPLTPAVTTEIAQDDGERVPVLESSSTVEIEGAAGERMVCRRPIVSEHEKADLIHVWDGAALTQPDAHFEASDYYVRLPGAAQREAGFHKLLATFAGWALPEVATWDGKTVPLYSEILAPFFYVEQTKGWSWIGSVMPRYLRVRDPDRRAVEFLMSLDALTRARDKDVLDAQREELRVEWRSAADSFRERVAAAGALLENVPRDPSTEWPPTVGPRVRVLGGDTWRPLGVAIEDLRQELASRGGEVPSVGSIAEEVTTQLHQAEEHATSLAGLVAAAARDVREQQGELRSLDERLTALREDRFRYDDAIRLRELGSLAPLATGNGLCPTCEQQLPATLIGDVGPVMTLEDNRRLIDDELTTFRAMRSDGERVLAASRQRLLAARMELNESRSVIRSLKRTLTQNADAPSRAAIERQIRLEDQIVRLQEIEEGLAGLEETLSELSAEYGRVQADLKGITGPGGSTASDRERLLAFEQLFREQLGEYGFTSVPPGEVGIGLDTYLPTRGDAPIRPEELSASDRVRVVWAYLVGLLEIARRFETPHPGILVFDEPGQQDISDESLRALIHRLSATGSFGQQVILATSKRDDVVRDLTSGVEATIMSIDGYALKLAGS